MTTDVASTSGLQQPGFHGSVGSYLRWLWARREYAWYVPQSELRSQQMNTVLGNLWHLLNPILSISVYYVVFGVVLQTDRGVENYIAFLAIGVFVFSYSQKSTTAGSNSIVRNLGLIRSINFPRALMPVTSVITEALAFFPGIAVFLAVTLLSGEPPRWSWLLLPAIVLLQTLFNVGAALVAARSTHSFRDIHNLLPFVFRLLFYASGVLFSVDSYVTGERARFLFVVNPLYDVIALYRWAVLGIGDVGAEAIALGVWTVALLVGGLAWFRRGEALFGA